MAHEEYLRRNLVHCSAVGVTADLTATLDRLLATKQPPKWLVEQLKRTHAKSSKVPVEVARWRDTAPDAPHAEPTPMHDGHLLASMADLGPINV